MRASIHFSRALPSASTANAIRGVRCGIPSAAFCTWHVAVAATIAIGGAVGVARAAEVAFDAAGGGDWGVATNWSTDAVPTAADSALFGPALGDSTIYLEADRTVSGLRFTNTGRTDLLGSVGTTGNGFNLSIGSDGIVIDSNAGIVAIGGSTGTSPAQPQRIGLALTASQTWTIDSTAAPDATTPVTFFRGQGQPTPGSNLDLGAHTLTITGSGVTELRGGSIGSGGIVKQGTGTLFLGNDKTFSGGVRLDAGALGLINGTVLGSGTLTINGGRIFPSLTTRTSSNPMVWGGDFEMRHPFLTVDPTVAQSLALTGSVMLTGNRTVTVNNGDIAGTPTFFAVGAIGDGGNGHGLTKAGPNPLVLIGDNTYTGVTTVSEGALQIGGASSGGSDSGSLVGNVVLDGAATSLVIDRNSAVSYGGAISGSGSVVKNGIGSLTLTGTNSYTGTLTINGGALALLSVDALPGWDTPGRYSIGAAGGITFGNGVTAGQITTIFGTGNVDPSAGTGFDTTAGNRTFSDNLATAFPGRSVFKTGPNALILDGQSTNTTTLSIGGGTVRAASAEIPGTSGPLGLGSIVFAGGVLQYSGLNQTDYSPRFTADTQVYAADTAGQDVTWSRLFSLGNGGGISKGGAGTLTLSGGSVTMAASQLSVSGGTLSAPGVVLTSTTPAVLDVTGGGRLELGGINRNPTNVNQSFVVNGNGEVAFATFANLGQGLLTVSGGATVFFPSGTVNSTRSQLLVNDGVIVGDNLRNSTQTSSFGNPNDVNRAVIRLGNAATSGTLRYTGTGNSSDRQIQIGNGVGGGGSQIEQNGASGALTLSGAGGFFNVQDAAATVARSLTLSGSNVGANTISGVIRDNSASGTVAIVKSGPGRWTLSGANTYSGGTTVAGGTLGVAGPASLPGWNTGGITVASGATLAVGSGFGDADIEALLGSGVLPAGSAIGFSTASAGYGYDRGVAGDIGVTKLDANQLTLGGTNTYTGPTSILGGSLVFTAVSAVSAGTTFDIGGGATLGFSGGPYTLGQAIGLSGSGIRTISAPSGTSVRLQGDLSRVPAAGNVILSVSGAGDVAFEGAIGDFGTGGTSFGRVGVGGTTSLLGLNSFGGTVNIDNGILVVNTIRDGVPSSIGTGAVAGSVINPGLNADSGTLRYIGAGNAATARQVRIGRGADAAHTGGAIIENAGTGSLGFTATRFNLPTTDTAPRPLTVGGTGDGEILGEIGDNSTTGSTLAVNKTGTGTWRLGGTNTYTGATTVSEGTLVINGNQTAATGAVTVASGGTLGGAGVVGGATTIESGATLSPGASPGTLAITQNVTLSGGGNYNWQILDATGTAGSTTGWDLLSVGGALSISATSADPFQLNLWSLSSTGPDVSGNARNFSPTQGYTWRIASAAGGITGFASDAFAINTAPTNGAGGFANGLAAGSFSLAVAGNDLNLVFSPGAGPTDIVIDVPSGSQTQGQAGYASIAAATSVTKTGAGTVVFDAANAYTGPTTVSAGTLQVTNASGLGSTSVTVDSGATLAIAAGTTMKSPSVIVDGGTLSAATVAVASATGITSLAINAGTISGSPVISVGAGGQLSLVQDARVVVGVGSLSVAESSGGGRLDVGAGQVSIAAGGITAAELRADIIAGRAGGAWTGSTGITSSTAAASGGTRGVGYVVAADGSARVSFAASGDVDLSGAVNVFDLVSINSSGRYGTGASSVWNQGDFNYDGVTNVFDLVGVNTAGAYGQGNYFPAAPSVAGSGSVAAVPEPGLTAAAITAVIAAGVAGMRRRRNDRGILATLGLGRHVLASTVGPFGRCREVLPEAAPNAIRGT